MHQQVTRRELLFGFGPAGAGLAFAGSAWATAAPAAPVAVARCRSYDETLVAALDGMFNQLGGLPRLVKGKTVAIKINLTGSPAARVGYVAAESSHWTHPRAIGAVTHLIARAGARRIRILESAYCTAEPLEEFMLRANWDPQILLGAAPNVELENTNWLGKARDYAHFRTPGGGLVFESYDLNPSYRDCDVFVSLAKLKEHATCGVTLSMKNSFGITPATIYGDNAGGKDAPLALPQAGRGILHTGARMPAGHRENDPKSPRKGGYRVPRIVADLVAARPIDLAIIEGVTSMAGGEGPWITPARANSPGLLVAGTNPVCTDAVATALMGFDPAADRGVAPFEHCDNHLRLAEQLGAGTCDLKRIEVLGTPIAQAVYPFRKVHS
jgi:uncharacterized protein (DUF362 family)